MATNPYISKKVRSEQNLYEDLVIESLKFYGEDVYYIPREIVNKDTIFADDVPSRFSDAYKIETYIENTEGFDGEGDLFTKFGIELRDQATFVFARRRWKKLIGDNLAEVGFRPREGDIIYLPMSNSMFEVMKVETETPFYQLSQLPVFRMQCELFEYSDEDFDTNIASIDAIEYEGAYQYKLTMNTTETLTPTLVSSVDESGRLTEVSITYGGEGFSTPPTATFGGFGSTVKKFGLSSLHSYRGHGEENSYLLNSENGTIETFIQPIVLPSSGSEALFLTGGDSDKNTMMFGLNNDGKIVYSFGNNDGQQQKVLNNTALVEGQWSHLLIGNNNNSVYIYLNGDLILDSVSDRPLKLMSDRGYSIGASAARDFGGISYGAFNGYIDEYRGLTGNKSTIFDPRLVASTHTTETYQLSMIDGNGEDYTFAAGDSDRNGEVTDLTDPDINLLVGDTLNLRNQTGGHPAQIKDDADNVLHTQDAEGVIVFTPSAVGNYTYGCTVSGHENMLGNIIVSAIPDTSYSLGIPTVPFDSGSNTSLLSHFDGDSAEISMSLTNGVVTSVTITDSGQGYVSNPTITVTPAANGGNFLVGETVTQTNSSYTIKGEVTRWSDSDRILQLAHVGSTDGTFKTFSTSTKVVGASSNAEWIPKLAEDVQEIQPTAQNKVFDDFEADFLDFSESNPFGDMF